VSDAHSGALAHQFDSLEQQKESATLGMWLFLVQEILFFGGLFVTYLLYRWRDPIAFQAGSATLDIKLGLVNTVVLIASSLTMALAVRSAQIDQRKPLLRWLGATGALGFVFLVIKYFEYSAKWHHHLIPGANFHFEGEVGGRAELYFSLYFAMTGMHALHMIIGIAVLGWLFGRARKGEFGAAYYNPVECFGLYWHFVDIVWIFLFPLLYLIGRHYHGGA
jgi:cytochrome c oxidase subunit III